jgi:transposase
MRRLTIPDSENMILAIQDEIRRNDVSRYDHRLHAVLLIAQGMSCPEVAEVLGDSPRTLTYWVQRFTADGLSGLMEAERSGRPSRLSPEQYAHVEGILRASPREVGISAGLWDGPTLSRYLQEQFGVELKTRQCQRLFRQMGFRLRKPRPQVSKADPAAQAVHKKTPPSGSQG